MTGFKGVKKQVIECLLSGRILHEQRSVVDVKNLLLTGVVSEQEVAEIIKRSRGNEHSSSPHHYDSEIEVHVITTKYQGKEWYIKWYFVEPDSVFISVHETRQQA